jgi:hypothetical protein
MESIAINSAREPGKATLPRGIAEYWADWHDMTPEDAPRYVYEDHDGAFVCECCGVNYNPQVDRD